MHSVVWWTCALSALAAAHVYERCELARALSDQGIARDHLATWVCIAYHESRFDTAAQNYNSGDHGLLQISQLYWCGPGKACGVSCASLRDEDISNDVECALRIHEEHTRIQGDGFMAWVVYPLYCKQNTKKYLEGCEESLKNITLKPTEKSRIHNNVKSTSAPPYLSISSILRGQYENEVNSVTDAINWLEYKFDNVDDLSLPEYDGKSKVSVSDRPLKPVTNAFVTEKSQPAKIPAFLTIPSLLQEYLDDLEKTNEGEKKPNWVDVTFDNIDELKLPVSKVNKNTVVTLSPTKSKTRIKIADTNSDKTKTLSNSPNYLKVSSIVGAYLILTFPHFLYADQAYMDSVDGLTPNEADHEIFIDIEPYTGFPVRAAKRAQFNMFLKPVSSIVATNPLFLSLTPLFWIEEGVELTDELVDELKRELLSRLNLVSILVPVLIAVSAAVMAAGVVVYVLARRRAAKTTV